MITKQKNKQPLGLFSLMMIAIVSVDSLRNLPIGAQYGFSLLSFYMIAGICFFLPLTWIASKLTAKYPTTGGSYVWIEKAYGPYAGHLSIWLQWIYNMIWYPTIFAFINVTLASLIAGGLENSKWFILLSSLGFFWLLTAIHCLGLRAVSWVSAVGTIIGTILPMIIIIALAGYWLFQGNPSATPFTWQALLPNAKSMENMAFFSNILFSLLGLEIISTHAGNVINPKKTYPKAFYFSALLILSSIVASSLSLCIILPYEKIGLINGLINVFDVFFAAYHIPYAAKIISMCIIIGSLAITSSWMIGLARGLHTALTNMNAPNWIRMQNKNGMPHRVLIMQALVYTVLLFAFLMFPSINQSYWILSALTAQFALIYYVLLFFAAGKLLRQHTLSKLNLFLSYFFPLSASTICIIGVIIGFLPPEQISSGSIIKYEAMMIACVITMIIFPLIFVKTEKKIMRNLSVTVGNQG